MGIVEELESAIDIVELVSKYASLKKAGVNYKSVCPFPGHSEKTPSFVVSPAKQLAYCFGCHKGGGPLKFIMDLENYEFKEAIEVLGNYTGIKVNSNFDSKKFEKEKSLYGLYKDAVNFYKNSLKENSEIRKYLLDRGLTNEFIDRFNFGYANSGIELFDYLKNKGYDNNIIEESKIFLDIRSKKDKFINRIIFPISNLRGDFVALAGRIVGSGEPKYLNSPASKIYDKSNILYGLFEAKSSITKEGFVIITEGYMDAISLQIAGFCNSVAVSGTALTQKHLTILKRITHKIYLCFDGDKAGEKATKLSLELMKNKGFEVKIISLPLGKDPDDVIKSGKDFKDFIDSALSPIGYYIKKSKYDESSLEDKKNVLKVLLEMIKSYSDNIEKDFYLKEVSKLLDINMNIIYDSFNKTRIKQNKPNNLENENKEKINITSEDLAIGYIILNNKNKDIFKKEIVWIEEITNDLKSFLKLGNNALSKLPLDIKEKYRGISMQIEEENKEKTGENIENNISSIIKNINKDIYKNKISKLKNKANSGDNDGLKEFMELQKQAKQLGIK